MLKQATIAERANAFRQQCELAETMKLKEINLYASGQFCIISLLSKIAHRLVYMYVKNRHNKAVLIFSCRLVGTSNKLVKKRKKKKKRNG